MYKTYNAYRYQKLWNANSRKIVYSIPVLSILFIVTITFYVESGLGSGANVQSFVNQDNNLLSSLYEKVSNSTVQIISTSPFSPEIPNATEIGAGFIYDDNGSIVTGNHILQGADSVDLILKNGDRYIASVVGRDVYSDLAVLRIKNISNNSGLNGIGVDRLNNNNDYPSSPDSSIKINQQTQAETQGQTQEFRFKPLSIGNSSELEIGDLVLTVGYPFGTDSTMTSGMVGQKNYLLRFPTLGFSVPDTIVTDITVNPGNSGGPLINDKGEVVGIIYGRINPTAAPLGQFPGLTVGIPSSIISRIIPALIENGTYTHPATGIIGSTLTINFAQRYEEIPLGLEGVVVNKVVREGTADMAGVEPLTSNKYGEQSLGDIIVALDYNKITGIEELISYIQGSKNPGDDITFTVYRDGMYKNLSATVQPLE